MYKVREAIIVEGIYDKTKLAGFIDGVILTTHGFAVYSNDDFIKTIEELAKRTGIVILTDSDSAGMRIRKIMGREDPVQNDGRPHRRTLPPSQGRKGFGLQLVRLPRAGAFFACRG